MGKISIALIFLFVGFLGWPSADNDTKKRKELIKQAEKLEGKKYNKKYKGTRLDCSGYTAFVYDKVDETLPRRSADQFNTGKKVKKSKARPGDLIFFTGSKINGKVGHVGIVTIVDDGTIEFIHVSSSKGVRKDLLSSKYWSPRFLGVRSYF